MEHVRRCKRQVVYAQKTKAAASKELTKATEVAATAKEHADRQRHYLEEGGCLCGAMTAFAPYDPTTHGALGGSDGPRTHKDLSERFLSDERLCECLPEANRRERGTNLGNVGKEGQPMDVECQRKLTRRAVDEEEATAKRAREARPAVLRAEHAVAEAKAELEDVSTSL